MATFGVDVHNNMTCREAQRGKGATVWHILDWLELDKLMDIADGVGLS